MYTMSHVYVSMCVFTFSRQGAQHLFMKLLFRLDKLSKETTVANAIFGGFYRSQGSFTNICMCVHLCVCVHACMHACTYTCRYWMDVDVDMDMNLYISFL